MLKANINQLNEFFNNTAKRVTNKSPKPLNGFNSTISTLPNNHKKNPFSLDEINADDLLKTFKSL